MDYIDLKMKVIEHLKENNVECNERIIDLITEEFATRIENYEDTNKTRLRESNKIFTILLERSISSVNKRFRNVTFSSPMYDVIEDDYSEESNADFILTL